MNTDSRFSNGLTRAALLVAVWGGCWPVVFTNAHGAEIAIVKSGDLAYYEEAIEGFRGAAPSHVTIREHNLKGSVAEGRAVGRTIRAAQPDLVFAVGLKAALAAKLEIPDIPVVFCLVLNPERYGLPTANMTGIRMTASSERQLDAMRLFAPKAKRIGLLYHEDTTGAFVAEARRQARKLGIELASTPVAGHEEVPAAMRALLPKIDLFWLIPDPMIVTEDSIGFFLETSFDAKVPIFAYSATLVEQGVLGAVVVQARDAGQQAGRLAGGLLRGETVPRRALLPADAPQLALNLNSAEYFGLAPSAEVMRIATILHGGTGALAKKDLRRDVIP